MKKAYLGIFLLFFLPSLSNLSILSLSSQDVAAMQALKASLGNPESLNWTDPNPCEWRRVKCSNNRVTHIQINHQNLYGSLPSDIKNLSSLAVLQVSFNFLSGPIPSLAGLSSLQEVHLGFNLFTSISTDFFSGLTSLKSVTLDFNPLDPWEIPTSLKDARELHTFSANLVNLLGTIPDFLGGDNFPRLRHLQLIKNNLEGPIPLSFGKSSIQTLWLNEQTSYWKLNGSLEVCQNMTSLTQLILDVNHFTGTLPDFSRHTSLEELSLWTNELTGIVPLSLINLPNLTFVSIGNNYFQGPFPKFNTSKVEVDKDPGSTNSFCSDDPGIACDSRVDILLSIAKSLGYPLVFAQRWKGNEPCNGYQEWKGIACNKEGNITAVDFHNLGLLGIITPDFSLLTSLEKLNLSSNALSGSIPNELTSLPNLKMLDVSNNHLSGNVPKFRQNMIVRTDGNPDIVRENNSPEAPPDNKSGKIQEKGRGKHSNTEIVLVSVLTGAAFGLFIVGLGFCLYKKKQNHSHRIHRPKIVSVKSQDARTSGIHDHVLGVGNTIFSIDVLREVTNNFREQNILGRGGFGIVYKGQLEDGTKIAVKRMEEIVSERRLKQFKSEIAVLTKVRHRHLVALLGYCLDGKERLLVYEFMSQGTLCRHLFNWKNEGLKPLDWSRRLIIALDVARGVEYLHGLAHESFIHRDLKPSNILLGDDMRAKIADFGLVRLAPENGKHSTETGIAGTFGYLAPEYVVTGRVTTRVDVFSFGVILMELITGRKVVDESDNSDPENIVYLVTWFRTQNINQDTFRKAVDETIEHDNGTLASVREVAELADRCCASEPYKRPDMARVVNVLSSLAEL